MAVGLGEMGDGRRLGRRWGRHAGARVPGQDGDRSPERLDEIQQRRVDIRESWDPDEALPEGFRAVREAVWRIGTGKRARRAFSTEAVHYC